MDLTPMQHITLFFLTGFLALVLPKSSFSEDEQAPPVQIELRFPDAARQRVEVEVLVPTAGIAEMELVMPNWAPGSYLIRDYARNIEFIRASDAVGTSELTLRKTATNRWLLSNPNRIPLVRLSYRLYCREMSVRTNWVQADFAVLNGPATFITSPLLESRKHLVRCVLPTSWGSAICGLPETGGIVSAFVARDWSELIDSPMVFGNPKVTEFEIDSKKHRLVTLNDAGLWDNAVATEDVRRIVENQRQFWGELPYPNYTFLNVVSESGGGLEHDNSSLLMTSRWTFGDPIAYRRWLGLVSHEFFHVWNVRRLRPKVLTKYDLDRPNLFDELWIAEGLTSYYDELLLVRSGLLTENDYLKSLSQSIRRVMEAPGNEVQSLRDSSRDAWIKFYRPDENDINSRVNYYTKGSLVGMILDAKIRQVTADRKSLDDVMRVLYARHSGDRGGYDNRDFYRIVDEVAGTDLSTDLALMIEAPGGLDFQPVLDRWGLRFATEAEETLATQGGADKTIEKTTGDIVSLAPAATAKPRKSPYTGATVRTEAGRVILSQIILGSPADRAGWNVDDELVALGGFRVTDEFWNQRLAQFPPGKEIPALIARRGVLFDLPIVLAAHRENRWDLKVDPKATDEQKKQRSLWLDQPQQDSL